MSTSGRPWHECPNIWRNVTAGSLLTVSGAPIRCAGSALLMNGHTAVTTVVLTGADAVDVTFTLGIGASMQVDGEWSAVGTIGTATTVAAGWFDDGSVRKNG